MPRIIRVPTEDELPDGPVRDFVRFLFMPYQAARRPTLETVSGHIRDGDYAATASTETVRRMLNGTSVPAHWQTVEAVVLGLCNLADWHPDREITFYLSDGRSMVASVMHHAETLWNLALDAPPTSPVVVVHNPGQRRISPAATQAARSRARR